MKKEIGVLCHVTSIPCEYGVGDFGKSSFDFVDSLAENKINIWQILPLNITNEFNCPYSSISYFTFDEMFVDLDNLVNKNLLVKKDLKGLKRFAKTEKVDFKNVKKEKLKLFEKSFNSLSKTDIKEVENFCDENPQVLEFAYFRVLLKKFNTCDWREVPKLFRDKESVKGKAFLKENYKDILKQCYFQFVLLNQWKKLKSYANQKGIKILGDMPVYPSPESFDVFKDPEQFKLNKKTLKPLVFGGVPADQMCPEGQNWGGCVYDWDFMKTQKFQYMIDKISYCKSLYDILRIDHFIGYIEHYEYSNQKGIKTGWVKSGGKEFFKQLKKECDFDAIVVEDLGLFKPEVIKVRDEFSLKGMSVVQMILEDDRNDAFIPKKAPENSIIYLGTHDSNTFLGYLNGLDNQTKQKLCELLNIKNKNDLHIHFECMKQMLTNKSEMAIFQIQDLLQEGADKRMNVPGRAESCWEYKAPKNYKKKFKQTLRKIGYKKEAN